MRPFPLAVVLTLTLCAIGCGSKSPVQPTPPKLSGLAIHGADAVLTGVPADYTATATLTDGSTRTVQPTWATDNAALAIVDGSGRLEGRAHGAITLTASAEGQTATKRVQVVNNYKGTWDGNFIVNGCDAPPGVCADLDIDWYAFPIYLRVFQGGPDQSDVTATLILSSFFQTETELTGRVTGDGRLNLAGSSVVKRADGSTWATFHVGAWDSKITETGMMAGRWTQRLTILQPAVNEYMENQLAGMKRTSDFVGPIR